ncbi:YolD-like family protein [Lysinibacillus fusiformis]|uniref:YolD-like family protein n=1 Tax=Lysinibacillus fusiformis TaxID=28031 RepID=UPI0038126463
MIKDRGNIKWASMMMPEHLDLLRECKEVYTAQPRELTEWELEELQQTIDIAYHQQQDVQLTVWNDGKIMHWTGIIHAINLSTSELLLETLLTTRRVPIHHIQSAQLEADYYD